MQVVAFFGVRTRLAPCLVTVEGSTVLDEYAMVTFAAQPALLSKLLILVTYVFLLSLGVLVFRGRVVTEAVFVADCKKTQKNELKQPIRLATSFYGLSRWLLYGICLGTIAGRRGAVGFVTAWTVALFLAIAGAAAGGFKGGKGTRFTGLQASSQAFCVLLILLALPITKGLAYLPISLLYLGVVKGSYFLAGRALLFIEERWPKDTLESTSLRPETALRLLNQLEDSTKLAKNREPEQHAEQLKKTIEDIQTSIAAELQPEDDAPQITVEIKMLNPEEPTKCCGFNCQWREMLPKAKVAPPMFKDKGPKYLVLLHVKDEDTKCCGCKCGWLEPLIKKAASATHTAVGWMKPVGSLKLSSGMSMCVQGLEYGETSLSTLSGGLACVLGSLMLSPLVIYGKWAEEHGRLEPAFDASAAEEVGVHSWLLWTLATILFIMSAAYYVSADRMRMSAAYYVTGDSRVQVILAIPFVALIAAVMHVMMWTLAVALLALFVVDVSKEGGLLMNRMAAVKPFKWLMGPTLGVFYTIYLVPFVVLLTTAVFFSAEALRAHGWALWLLAAVQLFISIFTYILNSFSYPFNLDQIAPFKHLKEPWRGVFLIIYLIPFVTLIAAAIFFTTVDGVYLGRIRGHVQVCYTDSFAIVRALHIEWSALLPLLQNVYEKLLSAPTAFMIAVAKKLSNPLGMAQEVVESFANVTSYLKIDPSHFAKSMGVLDVINVALGLLKLLATYGRKAFQLFDAVKGMLSGIAADDDEDDGTVQLHECLADPVLAQIEAEMDAVCSKVHSTLETVQQKGSTLDCSNSSLYTEDAMSIAVWLKGNNSLTSLSLCRNSIGDAGGVAVAEALRVNGSLTSLDVGFNTIGKDTALNLVSIFKVKQMTSVGLAKCSLNADDAKVIAEYVRVSDSLTSLNLLANNFDIKTVEMLLKVKEDKARLMTLCGLQPNQTEATFQECGLEPADAKLLAPEITASSSLTALNLFNNNIGKEGGAAIAEALKQVNGALTTLNLERNNLGDEGAKAIAEALLVNRSLKTLSLAQDSALLQDSKFGTEGGVAFAKALKVNGSLTSLNLARNNLGDEGAKAIAEALLVNRSLKTLLLWDCKIGTEGGVAFATALKVNDSLTSLDLKGFLNYNNIDDTTKTSLKEATAAKIGFLLKL